MEEIARVYAEALFGAAKGKGNLDAIYEQLGQFADALAENRELQHFLELLTEKHRMPVLFRIRRNFDALWAKENKRLGVTVTSAVELDPEIAERIGSEIEKQTGNRVELQRRVDPDILGGLVVQVGNMVLDTSIRNRLEKLRKSVAQAA